MSEIKKEKYQILNLNCQIGYEDESRICAIILKGSMDTEPIIKLQGIIKDKAMPFQYDYVVDLNGVTFIGSTGLGFLMTMVKMKRNFVFVSYPDESISKPFRLLGVNFLFRYYLNFDDLKKETTIPSTIIDFLKKEVGPGKEIKHHERWVKILADYLTNEQLWEEIQAMDPYIHQSKYLDNIVMKSETKYACILYEFMNRILNEVTNIDKTEINEDTVELLAKELISNAVHHGYGDVKDGTIEADYKLDQEKLIINVTDYGQGFNQPPENITDTLGLQIVKKVFDVVEFHDAPKKQVEGKVLGKGTTVRLIKYTKSNL